MYTNIKLLYVAIVKVKKLNSIFEVTKEEIAEEELDSTCMICLNDVESGKLLECKHVFHLTCLKKWVLHTNSCPSCKRTDVIFVNEQDHCPIKEKIRVRRSLLAAGVEKAKVAEELNAATSANADVLKMKYRQIETRLLSKHKRAQKQADSDSDDVRTEDIAVEVRALEQRITYLVMEISKAKNLLEAYEGKLTRRLQRKQKQENELKAEREALLNPNERVQGFEQPPEDRVSEPKVVSGYKIKTLTLSEFRKLGLVNKTTQQNVENDGKDSLANAAELEQPETQKEEHLEVPHAEPVHFEETKSAQSNISEKLEDDMHKSAPDLDSVYDSQHFYNRSKLGMEEIDAKSDMLMKAKTDFAKTRFKSLTSKAVVNECKPLLHRLIYALLLALSLTVGI